VERVAPPVVLPLRHAVLRPGRPVTDSAYAADATAVHLAAYDGDRVVGVATVFPEPDPDTGEPGWRLRGMAVDPAVQGCGVGAALLAAVLEAARAGGAQLVWCNARVAAIRFYERHGLVASGDVFDVPHAGPHRRMRTRLSGVRPPHPG
jgi:GNAT superfamily N-acetyltransferase